MSYAQTPASRQLPLVHRDRHSPDGPRDGPSAVCLRTSRAHPRHQHTSPGRTRRLQRKGPPYLQTSPPPYTCSAQRTGFQHEPAPSPPLSPAAAWQPANLDYSAYSVPSYNVDPSDYSDHTKPAHSSGGRKQASCRRKPTQASGGRNQSRLLPLLRQLLLPQVRLLPPPAKLRSCGSRARRTMSRRPVRTPTRGPARAPRGKPSNGSMKQRSRLGTAFCSRAARRSPTKH